MRKATLVLAVVLAGGLCSVAKAGFTSGLIDMDFDPFPESITQSALHCLVPPATIGIAGFWTRPEC